MWPPGLGAVPRKKNYLLEVLISYLLPGPVLTLGLSCMSICFTFCLYYSYLTFTSCNRVCILSTDSLEFILSLSYDSDIIAFISIYSERSSLYDMIWDRTTKSMNLQQNWMWKLNYLWPILKDSSSKELVKNKHFWSPVSFVCVNYGEFWHPILNHIYFSNNYYGLISLQFMLFSFDLSYDHWIKGTDVVEGLWLTQEMLLWRLPWSWSPPDQVKRFL